MDNFNSQSDSNEVAQVTTTEDLLRQLRQGNEQKLEIGLGALKIPVRLLNHKEELVIIAKSKVKAMKDTPMGVDQKAFESAQIMRDILYAAVKVEGSAGLAPNFFESLWDTELSGLYDQYISLKNTVNPNIQAMSQEEIMELILEIKKKTSDVRNLFTYQLAEIGKYFLTRVVPHLPLQTDSVAGTD